MGNLFVVSVRAGGLPARRRDVPLPRSSTPGGPDAPGTRPSPPTLRGPRRSPPPCRAWPAASGKIDHAVHYQQPNMDSRRPKRASHRFSQTALRGLCRRERRRPLSPPERCRRPGEEDRAEPRAFIAGMTAWEQSSQP